MLEFHANKGPRTCGGLSRRDFLRAGSLGAGAVSLSLAELNRLESAGGRDVNCILLFLVGAPSQLDTWDPKPDAPANVRGPFRPTKTSVPGTLIAETFPLMAKAASRYAILRSVHHEAAPIHETGQQMMQTGHLFRGGREHPHYGSVLSHLAGPRPGGMPPFVVLPAPIGNTGVSVSHGQGAGYLGARHEPLVLRGDPARLKGRRALLDEVDRAQRHFDGTLYNGAGADEKAPGLLFSTKAKKAFDIDAELPALRERYGRNTFGQSCLLARRLVEQGVRLVTVNMFDTVFNEVTWDCHADGGSLAVTLDDYKNTLCPMFDTAYTALLDDLHQRGMLSNTLVLAMGEFGRTPQLNARGGRDHWPGVWSILFAGAGIKGGQVVGSSDRLGAEPRDRPVSPAEVAATVYRALGIDRRARLPGPEGRPVSLVEAEPVDELFRA
jgi:uncharacterized protein (DUF1501 family)